MLQFYVFMFLEMPFFATSDEETIKEFLGRAAMEMLLLEDGRGKSATNLFYNLLFSPSSDRHTAGASS